MEMQQELMVQYMEPTEVMDRPKGEKFPHGKFLIFGDCQIVKERIIFNFQILVTI